MPDDPTASDQDGSGVGEGPPAVGMSGAHDDAVRGDQFSSDHRRHHRRHRVSRKLYKRHRRVVWLSIVACTAVLVAAAWVGFRLWQTQGHLEQAAPLVSQLEQQLKDGDTQGASDTLHRLQDQTGAARSAAHDPLWSLGQKLPWAGPNLATARLMADAVDDLAWKTLPPLVDVAQSLDPAQIAPHNGVVDVDALAAAAPRVVEADETIQQLKARLADIDVQPLLAPVANAVSELHSKLDKASALTVTASRAAQLLPSMLGADGRRTYLVVFQNPAELRATGGIFGAYAVISADHGKIRLIDQGATSTDIHRFDEPVLPLTDSESAIYTDRLGTFPMDVNFTPDFPRAAELIREMYRRHTGVTVDGVIATDPVALSYILRGTGPISIPGGERLTADNAVPYLLSAAYDDTTPQQSDRIFQGAAAAVFAALVNGQGSSKEILDGLQKAGSERRLLIWSADSGEEALLAPTVLGGTLPASDGLTPTVGMFLNDGTGGKMDYYLSQSVNLESTGCRTDGRVALELTATLSTDAPAEGLPDYVTGLALGGPYVTRTNVVLVTPSGGAIVGMQRDGTAIGFGYGSDSGRMIGTATVDLKPGASTTLRAQILTAPLAGRPNGDLDLRTTPMAHESELTVGSVPNCASVDETPGSG